ncbi:MAG: ethanolamine ammonia-lyase subunit EutC [Janthinobacterium lividum]
MTEPPVPLDDPWARLRPLTPARIGLPRAGAALATRPLLDLRLAHARARDAVAAALDAPALLAALSTPAQPALLVHSRAPDHAAYLRRPDLGRDLDDDAPAILAPHAAGWDLAVVVADGLSARAAERQAPPLLDRLLPALDAGGWRVAPRVVLVRGRVAAGDRVAGLLRAASVLVLIGERPGLSTPDSLGAYLTWAPGPATTDADRNCVSNIHPRGLSPDIAAHRVGHLLGAMRGARQSGVLLKDTSTDPVPRLADG